MKAIICDLDGTLCDCSHRRHFVSGGRKDYDKFNAACVDDPLVIPIAELVMAMYADDYEIIFCSGRGNEWRHETIEWIEDMRVVPNFHLYMRPEGDYRSDVVVKREMLRQIEQEGYEVLFVVDDRPDVLRMWRQEGLFTLAVGPLVDF